MKIILISIIRMDKKVKGFDLNEEIKELNRKENLGRGEHNFTYTATEIIGSGSFGVVYKANVAETGETVAIKKVFQDRRYKNRELPILKDLNHPNCIKMRHAFYSPGDKADEVYLNIVMDYIPVTLSRIIRQAHKSSQNMPLLTVKLYSYQMLRSLAYIHAIGICHRDIKPQNVLVDQNNNILQMCDFGSAKRLTKGEPNVSYICSRYYRAPELIFGCSDYTQSIDIWSTACVIAELVLGQPIFPGESATDQIVEIIKILGTPNKSQILAMNPEYTESRFPIIKALQWSRVFKGKNVDNDFLDFIGRLLIYEPQLRPRPLEILLHPFFDELRLEDTILQNGKKVPDELFIFTKEEIKFDKEVIVKLIPNWFSSKVKK